MTKNYVGVRWQNQNTAGTKILNARMVMFYGEKKSYREQ